MKGPSYRLKEAKEGSKKKQSHRNKSMNPPPIAGDREVLLFPWVSQRMIFSQNGYCVILRPSITVFDSHPLHFSAAVTDLIFGKSKCWICYMQG
jgi:hypothetical protein